MREFRFQLGQKVRCLGIRNGVVVKRFWADAPGCPEDEHNRYYVMDRGQIWSCAESELVSAEPEKESNDSDPQNGAIRPPCNEKGSG